ncbi:COP9 signalosome, subunit CSN8, putative [Theobroma cacao]|uniref:COP9 signalosome, subunit CSN8, putative n=1 Tax=Theobroma cacao TaxID=3641 RepID=A0A061F4H7_THECC|nr:COP9 signalosome, subunit CSN8, putative [Theobroma cacao]
MGTVQVTKPKDLLSTTSSSSVLSSRPCFSSKMPLKRSCLRRHRFPKSLDDIADICDNLMLRVAAEGVAFQDEWPFAIHLLGHSYVDDISSARLLWKSIPAAIKESQMELVLLPGKLGCLDCCYISAYSTISIQDAAQFLGTSEDDAANYVSRQGWTVGPASQMLTVKKQATVREQKLDPGKLQCLTEYVFHLEHLTIVDMDMIRYLLVLVS